MRPTPLTADTITDEQIVELRGEIATLCDLATGDDGGGLPVEHPMRRNARARCAEIINARAVQP